MNTYDMLAKIIAFNREMMQAARSRYESIDDMESADWQNAYQIYRDCEDAFESAHRAAKYGFPGVE
jgi:hypothetical protein